MQQINNLNTLLDEISTGQPVLVYFSGENCSVCHDLKPKVRQAVSQTFPKIKLFEVEASSHKQIASHFTVFSIPTILVFFDSKEFFREGRNISIYRFCEDLKRPYNLFMD